MIGCGVRLKQVIGNFLRQFGYDPRRTIRAVSALPWFLSDLREYRRLAKAPDFLLPMLGDKGDTAGKIPIHYFHQDLWAARLIYQRNPSRHIDIGSSVEGFIAHLLAFREVELVDVRPLPVPVEGLTVTVGDATTLEMFADNSIDSISSLHAAEHFGLGRYGDPIDPEGHLRFMRALSRVLKPQGRLYFSVPCSASDEVYFNAHRILSPQTVLHAFGDLTLLEVSCALDDGTFSKGCELSVLARQKYGCGMFEFTK